MMGTLVNFPLPQGMLFLPYVEERREWMAFTYEERMAYGLMKLKLDELHAEKMEHLHREFWGYADD